MIIANIYERLPIYKLQELIGERQLESVSKILEALNFDNIDAELMHTRGFLAAYAKSTQNVKYLFTSIGARELLQTLSLTELNHLLLALNLPEIDCYDLNAVDSIIQLLNRKEARRVIGVYLGLEEYLTFDNVVTALPSKIQFEPSLSPYKPLKDYQFEVYFQANENLNARDSRFILQMPTGSGKTRTAMEIVCEYLNTHPNGSVVWLAHSTELCDQASECFQEVWPHLARSNLNFQRFYGPHKLEPIADKKIGFLCASFQSLLSRVEKTPESINGFLGKDRLIVVDEAHKVVAPTYKKVTHALMNDGSAVMGLTATPGRSYGVLNTTDENEQLSDFFFNTHISFNPHGKTAIAFLRDKGVLANVKFQPLIIAGLDIKLSSSELAYISRLFELPPDLLTKLGKNHLRNAEILNKLYDLVKDGKAKSILFFATSLEQSELISSLLNFLKIKAAHVDGSTPLLLRQEMIRKFRAQEISILCNYEVLATGFDAPLVDCVFIARPTASVVLYSQMIGRGLRGPAIGGKESCLIINVKDNILNLPGIEAMYEIFDEYWITKI